MLLLTLRGTPTLYYGDELGMTDVHVPHELAQDPWELNEPGNGRDPARTPMPWDGTVGGGFTDGAPWLPLGDVRERNIAAELSDPRSMLSLQRALIALRRREPALAVGFWRPIEASGDVLAYARGSSPDAAEFIVALNFSGEPATIRLDEGPLRPVLSTHLDRDVPEISGEIALRGNEGLILRVMRR